MELLGMQILDFFRALSSAGVKIDARVFFLALTSVDGIYVVSIFVRRE